MSAQEQNAVSMKPFRFSDLPRELRDAIYDLLPCGRRTLSENTAAATDDEEEEYALRLCLGDGPLSRFLLINKQLGDEYSQRAVKNKSLLIEDLRDSTIEKYTLPSIVLDITHVTFKLAACLPCREEDVNDQVDFVKNAVNQMKKNPTLHLQLYFEVRALEGSDAWAATKVLERYEVQLKNIQEMACLDKLELFTCKEKDPAAPDGKLPGLDGRLLATFIPTGGWKSW
ncbi:hypothetical protein CLAFUW4_07649 [Fulvia fulva]|uniref:Uncharacterized protein n=1 Tax=Passalora fulva TaxID=5499 RepID=A0A9Q8LD04_PASFU|nr:uncharacterized protein CLAFUR5_07777 [Fulvia fulva]KAK4629701.1 hypothetical protein CLAFUR4_07654 [Fulvia fulva]KAK4630089.1 hypothetical protein CLAFUR0_07654 [Fulvia fulva]UJO15276.1 hypothetical protein CLAFUR5_07777 [Fulvia fulva]WPV12902.1 hypothetical protein CLAFUW4_07649 [Fulvia fulva]WPV27968.1 hypothetical protein CLAFUW7_07650 [Fulvia fulva]